MEGWTVAQQIDLLRDLLARGLDVRIEVSGRSMAPLLRSGDAITLRPGGPPTLGDVLAFTHPRSGRLIVHRVIGRRGPDLLLGGDAAPHHDGAVPASHVLGRVIAVEREGRPVRGGLGPERRVIALASRLLALAGSAARRIRAAAG